MKQRKVVIALVQPILAGLSFFMIVFLILGTVTAIATDGIGSGNVAGWIQADSSVLALVAVFVAIERQIKRQRDLETEKEARETTRRSVLFEGIARTIRDMTASMLNAEKELNIDYFTTFNPALILHYRDLVRGIPIMDIPSPNMIKAVTMLPIALANLHLIFKNAEGEYEVRLENMRRIGLKDNAGIVHSLAVDILAHDL